MPHALHLNTPYPATSDRRARLAAGFLPTDVQDPEFGFASPNEEAVAVDVSVAAFSDLRPRDPGVSAERRPERGRARDEVRQLVRLRVDVVDRAAVDVAPHRDAI